MSYNVVVVDDDEILLLHNKIIQEVGLTTQTFNSAHKALTFSIAFLMMGNPCCFWTLTCLLWMAGIIRYNS
jgi:FixJ family two-component response regulator